MRQGFLPRIESVRGIAALTVVTYHIRGQFSDVPAAGTLDAASFYILKGLNGTAAVVAFFVISGFVLARSLEVNPGPGRYFRNRLFRLFPAAIAVVGLLAVLHHWFGIYVMWKGDFSAGNVLLNMLMIRTDINAVMWSMKVECFATPLILVSARFVQRDRSAWLWIMIEVLFLLSFLGSVCLRSRRCHQPCAALCVRCWRVGAILRQTASRCPVVHHVDHHNIL
jgi:peptidoglycan/LPS O-acetylase OafA/YrhL